MSETLTTTHSKNKYQGRHTAEYIEQNLQNAEQTQRDVSEELNSETPELTAQEKVLLAPTAFNEQVTVAHGEVVDPSDMIQARLERNIASIDESTPDTSRFRHGNGMHAFNTLTSLANPNHPLEISTEVNMDAARALVDAYPNPEDLMVALAEKQGYIERFANEHHTATKEQLDTELNEAIQLAAVLYGERFAAYAATEEFGAKDTLEAAVQKTEAVEKNHAETEARNEIDAAHEEALEINATIDRQAELDAVHQERMEARARQKEERQAQKATDKAERRQARKEKFEAATDVGGNIREAVAFGKTLRHHQLSRRLVRQKNKLDRLNDRRGTSRFKFMNAWHEFRYMDYNTFVVGKTAGKLSAFENKQSSKEKKKARYAEVHEKRQKRDDNKATEALWKSNVIQSWLASKELAKINPDENTRTRAQIKQAERNVKSRNTLTTREDHRRDVDEYRKYLESLNKNK